MKHRGGGTEFFFESHEIQKNSASPRLCVPPSSLRDCQSHLMASALRLVDAVVEQDKCLATAFEAPRDDVIADDDATILTVEDTIADGEAGWGRGRCLLRVKRL